MISTPLRAAAASADTIETGVEMTRAITLYQADSQYRGAESHALFVVTGRGVRNPSFNHRVVRYGERLILSAQPTVIALGAIPTEDFHAGEIAIGDMLKVDGVVYTVTARDLADPELIPVNPATCPDCCPICGVNLKGDGYPIRHQHNATGDECRFTWDAETALQVWTNTVRMSD